MQRAVFYARVSTEEEKQLNALSKQIQENKDIIKEKGWNLVDQYIDEGKSGTTVKRRNDYQRMLDDIGQDKFDIIVVKDQDRLQRNTKDWYLFVDRLVQNKKKLFLYLEGKFFTPADDALITGIKAIIAEEYSRNLSKKLNNANQRRIERALRGEGVSAMGNSKSLAFKIVDGKWVKDEEEAKLGKLIFDLYLQMNSIRKVRDEVNNRGYTNSVGKPFTSESISRILKNEKAKGIIVFGKYHHNFDEKKITKMPENEWVRIEDKSLAYVSDEVFDEVQRRLKEKTGNKRGVFTGNDPLSRKIYCGKCGGVLWKHQSNGYTNWYCSAMHAKGKIACEGSHVTTVEIRRIYQNIGEDLVVNKKAVKNSMLDWLKQLKDSLSNTSNCEEIQSSLNKLEKRKNKLTDAYLDEIISKEDYRNKYQDIDKKIEELNKLLIPVEENEDIKDIESIIQNIDDEIDSFVQSKEFDDSKIDFLIEHTDKITVLEKKHLVIELDLIAGAIIAGKDFLLYVHSSLPFYYGTVRPSGHD